MTERVRVCVYAYLKLQLVSIAAVAKLVKHLIITSYKQCTKLNIDQLSCMITSFQRLPVFLWTKIVSTSLIQVWLIRPVVTNFYCTTLFKFI